MFGRKNKNYDVQLDIYNWNRLAGNEVPDYPIDVSDRMFWHRAIIEGDILREEVEEYTRAMADRNRIEYADALADIVIVAYGQAAKAGFNLNDFIQEAMEANWSKADPETGEFLRNEIGKIQKGPSYQKPKMFNVMMKQLRKGGAKRVW
jgi:predicted HAD superfamily Cof-like phosphohydrolase